jgi:hypothetical protein
MAAPKPDESTLFNAARRIEALLRPHDFEGKA